MKTGLLLLCAVALASAGSTPTKTTYSYKTKDVQPDFVNMQKKILSLFWVPKQIDENAEYYKVGQHYNIEANVDKYTNKKAVEEFLLIKKSGFLPKYHPFTIFLDQHKKEAIALFHLFFYAKDLESFYTTAAAARIYMNEGVFLYAYYIAVVHRPDTQGYVLPAPYEIYPEFFVNTPTWYKIFRVRMQNGLFNKEVSLQHGVLEEENNYHVIYSNYSDALVYPNQEYKLSYFTEDVGLNAYYYYFHTYFPFWMDGDLYPIMKERRGAGYYYFYQQLMARYYLERLSNGLGEIPEFSWNYPINTGFYPPMIYRYPFAQRPNDYQIPYDKHIMKLQFLDTYEKTFSQYLEKGHFTAYNQNIDLHSSKSMNFVGNYWQANYDLHGAHSKMFHHSYEVTARQILSGGFDPIDKLTFQPTALSFYQTSLRDPVFYQLYNKIMSYIYEYKQYVTPYPYEELHYTGVKVNNVHVDKLVTYFDYFDFDVSNGVFYTLEEYKSNKFPLYKIRQPRLNHKPFTVTINVKSDVEGDAVVKIFLGPKYDSNGYPWSLEENWKNFVELDWFTYKLTSGYNKIKRLSTDFYIYKNDSLPVLELFKYVESGKIPIDMSTKYDYLPRRLMLPKGTKEGYPYQLFVMVYPYVPAAKSEDYHRNYFIDNKTPGYPFDRPVFEPYFKQPNILFKDIEIYHEGEEYTYNNNYPGFTSHQNEVTKH